MKRLIPLVVVAAVGACSGTVPERNAPPEQAISAVLIGLRLILPSGETRNGRTTINFESEGGRQAEVYKLPLTAEESALYLVEPGVYRLAPTRTLFGAFNPNMKVLIEDREYILPFPRELLRMSNYQIKPSYILPIGVLEARVMPALPGHAPQVRVRLDDGVIARRKLIQDTIREMMDPRLSVGERESAIAWSRALQRSLMDLLSEPAPRQNFKTAQ